MFYLRSSLLLLGTIQVLLTLQAQPDIEWQATLGGSAEEIAYDVEQCPDGGYIVVGSSRSDDGDISENFNWRDFWVVKLNAVGELDWESTYGGSSHETARDVLPTIDGGYVVFGQTSSEDGQVAEIEGFSDYWVLKLSSTGSIEWERTLGGSGSEYGYAIEQTADGGYYVAGGSQSSNGDVSGNYGGVDYWVVRLSPTGDIIWENHFGGSRDDLAFSLDKTADGGCIVAGRTRSSDGDVSGFHGGAPFSFDCWVVKLSDQGVLEWERALGGTDFDEGYSVRQTSDGGYIVAGLARSSDGDVEGNPLGNSDLWVIKLAVDGTIVWENIYGGFSYDIAGAIREAADGGYIVTGCTGPAGDKRFWTIKITSTGELDWEKSYGGTEDDRSFSVKQTTDGGFVVAGRTASDNGDVSGQHGDYDFWVVKLGPCGVNTAVEVLEDGLQSLEVALSSTYQWLDCSTGNLVEGEQDAFLSPPVGGEYAVIITNGSCVDTSACFNYCPLPENLTLTGDTTLQVAEEVADLAIQWLNCNTDSIVAGATDPSYTPVENGPFAAVITSENCSATTECVYVCPEEIEVEVSISNDTLFVLTDTMAATKYLWTDCTTGGSFAISFRPYFVLDESGEYGVKVSQGGCTSELACLTYCAIDNQVNIDGNVLQALADPDQSNFQWINCADGLPLPGETDATFVASTSGEYAVIITQGSCVDTSQCTSLCLVDTELTLTAESIQVPNDSLNTSYQWIDCNTGMPIPGEEDYLFFPEMSGQYAAVITQGACVETSDCVNFCAIDTTLVIVGNTIFSQADTLISTYLWFDCITEMLFQNETDYTFTPAASGQYGVLITQGSCLETSECADFTIVGVEQPVDNAIKVFPNPAHDFLLVETPVLMQGLPYRIYATDGRVVHSGLIEARETEIKLEHLPTGVYVIELASKRDSVRKKIIKI